MADIISIIWTVIIGGVAGWLASVLMTGGGYGLIADILIGILGSVIGGSLFGSTGSSLSTFVVAFIGALLLLSVIRLFRFVTRTCVNC